MDSISSSGSAPSNNIEEPLQKLTHSYSLLHKTLLKSMNAYAIILSILLTISFCGFSQAPRPLFDNSQNHTSPWQRTFTYFNGFSFFSSVTGLLFYASSSCSPLLALDDTSTQPQSLERNVEKKLKLLANIVPKFFYVVVFFGVSLTCCILAYIFAGLSALPDKGADQIPVIITTVIGGFVYIQVLCVCCADAYRLVSGNLRPNEKLWEAMKKESLFGMVFGRFMDLLCSRLKKVSDADAHQGFDQPVTLHTSSSLDTPAPQPTDPSLPPL